MIELKRLKLINWHNFENVTFDFHDCIKRF